MQTSAMSMLSGANWAMNIKFKRLSNEAIAPTRADTGSAGWDLYAKSDGAILPHQHLLVPTDLTFEIPQQWVGFIKDRSSMAWKNKVHTHAGVIDSSYRANVGIVLENTTDTNFEYKRGDRIAQIVFLYVGNQVMEEVAEVSATERGQGGFGSSGR